MNTIFKNIIQTDTIGLTATAIKEQVYYILKIPQKVDIQISIALMVLLVVIEIVCVYLVNRRLLKKSVKDILK